MICTIFNNFYLQRGMCFDYVERSALLLNDLDGSMKLPSNFLSPHENLSNEHCPKPKIMKIKASGIVILQKSSRSTVY